VDNHEEVEPVSSGSSYWRNSMSILGRR
jgi:hypothetical protein